MTSQLPFDQRACFIAGQAKSGTTLLAALLDNHPQLLVLPEETAYFPTVSSKYAPRGRRAQFDYLTRESRSNVLFGGDSVRGKRDYSDFSREKFLETFQCSAFDPGRIDNDLLALMAESYAATLGRSLDPIRCWVEKTPANRDHVSAIRSRFPHAKLLVTMRDPRAVLATQIAITAKRKRKDFSTYYVVAHWQVAAGLAERILDRVIDGLVVPYEELATDPSSSMRKVCDYLEIDFEPQIVLQPTKIGRPWSGNSAAQTDFSQISAEPVSRWKGELSDDEIGWVEWHCRDLMPRFGYKPCLTHRALNHWIKPIRGERPREYVKSRTYSVRDHVLRR
jgi:Sulfotransferase family